MKSEHYMTPPLMHAGFVAVHARTDTVDSDLETRGQL
jgi:hypothetical protein